MSFLLVSKCFLLLVIFLKDNSSFRGVVRNHLQSGRCLFFETTLEKTIVGKEITTDAPNISAW